MNEQQQQQSLSVNVQEKANLIWAIADKLVGHYKPHEYGNVILPMCVIKRFHDTLKPYKKQTEALQKQYKEVVKQMQENDPNNDAAVDEEQIKSVIASQLHLQFCNVSGLDFAALTAEPKQIEENFNAYLRGFSKEVRLILDNFGFNREIEKLANRNLLYEIIKAFDTDKGDLSPEKISSVEMGYIFEELIRKFSESFDDQAGSHFTARDIIYLMADLLVHNQIDELKQQSKFLSIYDMTMGTSQMLACLDEKLKQINSSVDVKAYGQELNEQTYAIALADMLIKGGDVSNFKLGNTLSDDQLSDYTFNYIISNPPFGIEWKTAQDEVFAEHNMGERGRFAPGLPAQGDGQLLFMLNGVAKLDKDNGRMAIIQNGSSLFKGDATSGESNIRGYLLENDYLEAIVQLPNDLFYNTGIATYVWLVTKTKPSNRKGKVQLIDASKCFEKRRKSLGSKRVDISEQCRQVIVQAYSEFTNKSYGSEANNTLVESKVFDNDYFKYRKLSIQQPLRCWYYANKQVELSALKDKDRAYIETILPLYSTIFNGERMSDSDFFACLKAHNIKATQAQIKLIRTVLGTKDASAPAVLAKPLDPKCTELVADSSLSDTETIPFQTNTEAYLQANVAPFAPDFWVDGEPKIGYEIPFTREFYRYEQPQSSETIYKELQQLEEQELQLMRRIMN